MPILPYMSTNTQYPTSAGVRLGLNSLKSTIYPLELMTVTMAVSGTPGTSPSYQLEAQTINGNWVPVKNALLTARGQVSVTVEACAVRINANNGTSPGTTLNTPRYYLNTVKRYRNSRGKVS